jgi:two-component system NtrC family sensor kinase
VVLNLVNNAIDAISENGRVTVRTRGDRDRIIIEVEDDGCGIPETVQDRLFDPFFTTKAPGKGNGLGLSISHTIMQQLGGSLDFESTPGKGTKFRIKLPQDNF